jgi:hypothetical protein
MSNRRIRLALPGIVLLGLTVASLAIASSQGGIHGKRNVGGPSGTQFTADLIGHSEVPAIHTNGTGKLMLTINSDNTMAFTLTYSGLSSPAAMAHVHFGQPNVNGGVVFFFCGGSKPACPAGNTSTPVTVTGTVAASDILAPTPAQGLTAGDPTGIIQEIRAGFAYANVHTTNNPSGEIRGQLAPAGRHHDHGDNNDDDD